MRYKLLGTFLNMSNFNPSYQLVYFIYVPVYVSHVDDKKDHSDGSRSRGQA